MSTISPNTEEYTFYSKRHGSLFKADYILGHKENLYNFKNGEATLHILSDHNGTKLKIYGKQIPTNTEIH